MSATVAFILVYFKRDFSIRFSFNRHHWFAISSIITSTVPNLCQVSTLDFVSFRKIRIKYKMPLYISISTCLYLCGYVTFSLIFLEMLWPRSADVHFAAFLYCKMKIIQSKEEIKNNGKNSKQVVTIWRWEQISFEQAFETAATLKAIT